MYRLVYKDIRDVFWYMGGNMCGYMGCGVEFSVGSFSIG